MPGSFIGKSLKKCTLLSDIVAIPFFIHVAIFLHIIEGFMSYPLEMNMMSFFHQKLHMSDQTAGKYISANGVFVVLICLPSGYIIDRIGIRASLMLGFLTGALSRLVIAFSNEESTILLALNLGVSIGSALIALTLHIAADRIAEGTTKNIVFTLLYCSNNIGDTIAAVINQRMIAFGGVNEFQWIFIVTAVAAAVGWLITLFAMWPPELPPEQVHARESCGSLLRSSVNDTQLHRALLVAFILIAVRTMFRHLSNVVPLYEKRLYGEDVDYGLTISINPTGIIFLAPLFGIAFRSVKNPLSLIFLGTMISTLSPIPMLAWRPADEQWPVRLFVFIFTVGEAIYSPKVNQLAISLPPPGKKGFYSSLMTLPSIVGSVVSGYEAGYLLQTYCPNSVTVGYAYWASNSCANLWFIIMAIAAITPVSLLIFQNFIVPPTPPVAIELRDLS